MRLLATDCIFSLTVAAIVAGCVSQTEPPVPAQGNGGTTSSEHRFDRPVERAEEIREALRRCWSIDPNEPSTLVALKARLDSDGMVLEVEPLEPDRYRSDSIYRTAADRAIRAVINPACQPLPFRAEEWPSWQIVTLVFDPNPRPGEN